MSHDLEQAALSRYLEQHSLKHTKQREAILEVFLEATGHITSEAIFEHVRTRYPNIGYTTVYRTMKLLCDAGLAHERVFEDGVTRVRPGPDRGPLRLRPPAPQARALRPLSGVPEAAILKSDFNSALMGPN
jgi:hypothetical protein